MWVHSPTSTLRPSRGSRHDAAGPSAKGRARPPPRGGRAGWGSPLAASVPPDAGGHLFAQGPPARAARSPTGREKGGRKERGGRTGTAPHAFAKKSRKNRMRKHYRSIPEKRDAQESHTHSRRRRQESALREAGLSYRTTCSAPGIKTPRNRRRIRMATQICCRYRPTNRLPRGGRPLTLRGQLISNGKKEMHTETHTLSCAPNRAKRPKTGGFRPRRMPPKQPRKADGHSAVRCTDQPFWQARCGVRPNVRPARRASLGDKVPAGLSETVSGGHKLELEQSDNIAVASGMDMQGEQVAYLTGDLNAELWPEIHQFVCCCSSI